MIIEQTLIILRHILITWIIIMIGNFFFWILYYIKNLLKFKVSLQINISSS